MADRFTRINPDQNMARFYEFDLQPTLFGEYSVQRHWGRIGMAEQSKEFWFAEAPAAEEMARRVIAEKGHRGYTAMVPSPPRIKEPIISTHPSGQDLFYPAPGDKVGS